jgi:hypothetical protein
MLIAHPFYSILAPSILAPCTYIVAFSGKLLLWLHSTLYTMHSFFMKTHLDVNFSINGAFVIYFSLTCDWKSYLKAPQIFAKKSLNPFS